MITAKRGSKFSLALACLALVAAWAAPMAQAAPLAVPPRPEPADIRSASTGANIQLQVATNQLSLWTVVQWRDALGDWHDVEGWRGTLDSIEDGTGYKTWWVYADDFDKGPFRWVVYAAPNWKKLAASAHFKLPHKVNVPRVVKVSLP